MRIVALADLHRTSPDPNSKSLFPRQIAALGLKGPQMYELMREEIERAYIATITAVKAAGPWDIAIALSDVTGGYLERGSNHPTIISLLEETGNDLAGCATETIVMPGNHDLGYAGTGTRKGELSSSSIALFEERFGPLGWHKRVGRVLLLGVCSSLLSYMGSDTVILRKKEAHKVYIAEALAHRKDELRHWILFIDNPFAVNLVPEIAEHAHWLRAVFYGDKHNPGLAPGIRLLGKIGPQRYDHLIKSELCPSSAPLWWKGYAYRAIEIDGTEVTSSIVHVPRPSDSVNLPTSSFIRCALWMARRRR